MIEFNVIGYEDVGLLHSTALDYLQDNIEKSEIEQSFECYQESVNLSKKNYYLYNRSNI